MSASQQWSYYSDEVHLEFGVCYTCGKTCNSLSKILANAIPSVPHFRFLKQIQGAQGAKPPREDGSVLCCDVCLHSLMSQWKSFDERCVAPELRRYSLDLWTPNATSNPGPSASSSSKDQSKHEGGAGRGRPMLAGMEYRRLDPSMQIYGNQVLPNAPVATGALCCTCGKIPPFQLTYSLRTKKGQFEEPYFPRINVRRRSSNVCVFCYYSLMQQWFQNCALENPISPEKLAYNLDDYVCYVCGIKTYRERVQALSLRKFPFLRTLTPKEGAIVMFGGKWVVSCLTCHQTLTSQYREQERMKVPIQLRNYNWVTEPPPPHHSPLQVCIMILTLHFDNNTSRCLIFDSLCYLTVKIDRHCQLLLGCRAGFIKRQLPRAPLPERPQTKDFLYENVIITYKVCV